MRCWSQHYLTVNQQTITVWREKVWESLQGLWVSTCVRVRFRCPSIIVCWVTGPYQDWNWNWIDSEREKDQGWPSTSHYPTLLYSGVNNSTSASSKSSEGCFCASRFHQGCFTSAVWFLRWPWEDHRSEESYYSCRCSALHSEAEE